MSYVRAEDSPGVATRAVKIHGAGDFEGMRRAGRLAAEVLDMLTPRVAPGVTTGELDAIAREYILDHGATPAPYNYRGFPKSICTSLNHVVCHGIPGERVLKEGDLLNIDVTVVLDGWHGDTSRIYFAGKPSVKARRLCDITYECLMRGIAAVRPGARLGDIGHTIQSHAEENRCSVVTEFCGHGIGRVFHDAPNILHYGRPGQGLEIRRGMFFTIEPMINHGRAATKMLKDGWTAVTRDRSLSAQFEHTIGVTAEGAEIFTDSPKGYTKPPYNA